MKPFRLSSLLILPCLLAVAAAAQAPRYPVGPDSRPQEGVPKGEVLHFTFNHSRIFPGAFRDYWVYVPAQYRPDQPACLYVNQDGVQWNAPVVFDNLINKKEMPVTIGVFVMHGRVRAADGSAALDRFNRSYEYDGLGPNYARFLVEELLPEVETKKTSDGRAIHFSHDAKDRAIGGSSSGAVCAFTAAWERPDQFSRVFSVVGTYVGLRGADRYPTLLRKYETKPLRVFLQDGSADQNIYAGDWWMANQMMERALAFAGNEVQHAWGEGGHNGEQGTQVFPDAMRWLWKGWPAPVQPGRSRNQFLTEMLVSGQGWQPVADGVQPGGNLSTDAKGGVFFHDAAGARTYRVGTDGKAEAFVPGAKGAAAQAWGPDGRFYVLTGDGKLTAYDDKGKGTSIASGVPGHDLVVARNGNIYVTQTAAANQGGGKVWLIDSKGQKRTVETGLKAATGVTLSPDQTLLYVADPRTHWVYSYQIGPDGSLHEKQEYYWLHVPDTADESAAGSMAVDRDGRLYVATNLGVQVCDQAGRVNAILPLPGEVATNVTFGGEDGQTLYATAGGKVYRRKLAVKGAHAWDVPNKPAAPRL